MLLIPSAILLLLLLSPYTLAKDQPKIKRQEFDTPPTNLIYFSASDTILVQERQLGIVWRSPDAGGTWEQLDLNPAGRVSEVWLHPYDNQIAYILGTEDIHWVTLDQGKSWNKFSLDDNAYPSLNPPPLSFHAGDSQKTLLHAQKCRSFGDCEILTYYTTNAFKDKDILRDDTRQCQFAHSTPRFQTSADDKDDRRILCIVKGKYSDYLEENRLLVSDDYFKTEHEPELDGGRTVQGIISMAGVKGYIVTAAKAENTDELALYVTDDAKTWDHAEFPEEHKIKQEAYTILESTNYSIQVDVMTDSPKGFAGGMGVLFTSNSNGTYFTENIRNTNRGFRGFVDFEKVQDIQGIVIVNIVDNPEAFQQSRESKKRVSRISFDDGRTWEPLTAEGKDLHLHSVTEMTNSGRVFSSAAPGLVMGVGNTGDSLSSRSTGGDLYVSDDAGLTWTKALSGAHKYEFGDQGAVLLAVYDEEPTDEIFYSINHGKDWSRQKIDNESDEKIKAQLLTTTPDSTSLQFVMIGTSGQGRNLKFYVYSIDFTSVHERKCEKADFEDWWARLDKDGKPDCLMGHTQKYRRRKADADCFVEEEFKDPVPEQENCNCSEEDFECDYNFVRSPDRKECIPIGRLSAPEGQCKNTDDKYEGSSGWRLIAGNTCNRDSRVNKDDKIERHCTDTVKIPLSGKIAHEIHTFKANNFREYYYLERTETSQGTDETVVARTDKGEVYLSHDHGKTWIRILENEDILAIVPHQYFNDAIYFLTASKTVHYTINRGETFGSFPVPGPPSQDPIPVLQFHPNNKDWLIWTSSEECGGSGGNCHSDAHLSKDRGDDWRRILRYVRRCEFIKKEIRKNDEQLVYCEHRKDEKPNGEWELVSSNNWFDQTQKHFDDIIAFATMSEFIIVAVKDTEDSLKVDASVDGKTFADAKFPKNFKVDHQRAYTVLDSSTHSVFLNVLVETRPDFEYGTIIKSNSNGTSYVLSISAVNRNTAGYVDFEKMLGLEGVAMVNVVGNLKDVDNGRRKKLKTMITHNDGGEWAPLRAPDTDVDGKKYGCNVKEPEECSLHLHGFTERKDPRNAYSSPSAIGLMMGVGNVGDFLTEKVDANTFITRDGGLTWNEVMTGNYMWDYGDQGSIIVIVEDGVATNRIFYSTDEGMNWTPYEFMERSNKMIVESITSMPSDNSRNFLLWGKDSGSTSEIVTINLDFTGLTDAKCILNEEHPEDDDYYLWSPKHPLQDNGCLFGHVAQYHRKRTDKHCYNGKAIDHLHAKEKICECTRQDFECDFNFEMASDRSCQLVPDTQPIDHELFCKEDPNRESYFETTGYRRVPITDCQGGRELEFTTTEHPCPGHEAEYEKKHKGLSGFWLFVVAVLLPATIATGVGYWVYRNWDGSFGRIRLGETAGSAFDADRPWIQYPVAAVSAVVAVVVAVPLLMMSLWRSLSGLVSNRGASRRFTTRQSFARGRGDYAVVDPDEDELLGGDDDAEEA
ncbi:MAG: vacuolar protein sorting/targeting protein PEP1 [Icmadophila ericetorum]|nr:vacuolar protein sorting/targeting protein PEP1 [Icmadophila ericetorum]